MMKGSKIIIESLLQEKVDTIFAYIGGQVISIFDELYHYSDRLQVIRPHHEQAGTHAADGYSRSTGKVGVVLVTSGPGATNTVTGIATAYMDSVPMVVLTGQILSSKIGTDAFQEADIIGITLPITKANFLVRDVSELAPTLKKAFHIARSGRPGPVLVDIPSDIQNSYASFVYPKTTDIKGLLPTPKIHPRQITTAWEMIRKSRRPLALIGGGVTFSEAASMIDKFLDTYQIPAVYTLMGHGLNPKNRELVLGGIGMHGTPVGNFALQHADLILALGTRFSDRILGNPQTFASQAKIVQVDIDPAEIGKNRQVDVSITGRTGSFLQALQKTGAPESNRTDWLEELAAIRQKNPVTYGSNGRLKPQKVVEMLCRHFPLDTIVAADVGQNQMWVSQYFRFTHPRCFLSSGGLGTMGYALPAAIGARVGNPDRDVLMVAGDGGFQMNIQELATIKKHNLLLKMVVLDNGYLGMVRQWQELLCQKRYSGTDMQGNPDFAAIARAYEIKASTISHPDECEAAVAELARSSESMLLHAKIDPCENVLPMVPPGESLNKMIINKKTGEP